MSSFFKMKLYGSNSYPTSNVEFGKMKEFYIAKSTLDAEVTANTAYVIELNLISINNDLRFEAGEEKVSGYIKKNLGARRTFKTESDWVDIATDWNTLMNTFRNVLNMQYMYAWFETNPYESVIFDITKALNVDISAYASTNSTGKKYLTIDFDAC